jgi:hypothetical protein
MVRLRLATPADLPALRRLIDESVRGLSVGYYSTPKSKTPYAISSARTASSSPTRPIT